MGTQLTQPESEHWGIDSYTQRIASSRFEPLNQFLSKATIPLQIKLKPEWRFCCRCQFFDRNGRVRTDHKRNAGGGSSANRSEFSIGVHQALVGHRGQEDRYGQLLTKKRSAGLNRYDLAQYPRPEK